jgi:hypothetical protein
MKLQLKACSVLQEVWVERHNLIPKNHLTNPPPSISIVLERHGAARWLKSLFCFGGVSHIRPARAIWQRSNFFFFYFGCLCWLLSFQARPAP